MIGKNGEGLSAPATATNGNEAVEEEDLIMKGIWVDNVRSTSFFGIGLETRGESFCTGTGFSKHCIGRADSVK